MAIPNSPVLPPHNTTPSHPASTGAEWRCLECNKLLGMRRGGKLQVRVQGHDYLVSLPVEAKCRGCDTYNRT
ncbi:MAG: hypothetical protein ACOH2H_26385 [Cypionkella sp.]